MEQQIRDLCKGLGNVDVVRVESAKAGNLQTLIDRASSPTPTLTGHHSPSSAEFNSLEHINYDQLQENERHLGKVLHLTVTGVEVKNGALIFGEDKNGNQGTVWSLLLRPFGVPVMGYTEIAIKEPYVGTCPNGGVAVCVHHPTDCVLLSLSDSKMSAAANWKPVSSTGPIAVRPSSLGGRGVFATAPIAAGGLVLLEKAFALSDGHGAYCYGNGIEGVLEGERTNGRKLALLQHLVDRTDLNPDLRKQLFDLYAGDSFPDPPTTTFNTYRALSIIKHNAHTIFPGSTSDHHDTANKPTGPQTTSTSQIPVIWLQASLFNHSCLPNCAWAWTGDLFIARANRDVAEGEELTVAYVPTSYGAEKRKGVLEVGNGFECGCALCQADGVASRTSEVKEAVTKAQRLPQHVKGASLEARIKSAEELVQKAVAAYPRSTYTDDDGAELPCIQLAEPFYHLTHVVLDRAKNKHNWPATTPAQRSKAREYFTACLEVGLGYKLILDPLSPYCELVFTKHSQPRPIGVLSLMALAELAFIDGDKEQCRALKAWAKKVYGIWYGEDKSFEKQHLYFSSKGEPAELGKEPVTEEWKEMKREKMEKSNVAPGLG